MPELKKQASGDEKKLAVALFSPLIKDAPVEQIKEALRLVMVKVGLRANNWPNDLEKVILIQHIQENFGGNTLDEIKLSFDMAISGKLKIDAKEVPCYENFSCLYFSKIMNAYRDWAVDAILAVPTIPPEQKIFSEKELDEGFREDAERLYQMFLRGFALNNPEINKPILVKDRLMKEDETVINFFIRKSENGAKNIYVKK